MTLVVVDIVVRVHLVVHLLKQVDMGLDGFPCLHEHRLCVRLKYTDDKLGNPKWSSCLDYPKISTRAFSLVRNELDGYCRRIPTNGFCVQHA